MLMDVIGVFIAFSVVMLLLSLIVTSLNQATQATLRLRARNLRYGLGAALNSDTLKPNKKSLCRATEILNLTDASVLRRPENSTSITAKILGPRVTWLEPEELQRVLSITNEDEKTKGVPGDASAAVESFKKLEKPLRNRFENIMRGVSICWAVVIAAVFQISTPDLIKQLSVDPALRANYVAAAPTALHLAEQQVESSVSYDDVFENAITQLSGSHPELRAELSQLDTDTDYPEELAEQLGYLVEDESDRYNIISEFEEYLVAGLEEQRAIAFTNARDASDQLSLINITPLKHGMAFYTDPRVMAGNIIGVLMTAILLMLGAPFWYDTLKQAVAWRDLFSRR